MRFLSQSFAECKRLVRWRTPLYMAHVNEAVVLRVENFSECEDRGQNEKWGNSEACRRQGRVGSTFGIFDLSQNPINHIT